MIETVIVSRIHLYREGLRSLLEKSGQIDVGGGAGGWRRAVDLISSLAPDVVLVDTSGSQRFKALGSITSREGRTPTIALGVEEVPAEVVACVEAGACSYVARDAGTQQLQAAIIGAIQSEVHCPPGIVRALLQRVGELAASSQRQSSYRLTARELEITRLIDRGLSNKEIALELSIGLSTVKNHVHHILHKLHVTRRSEAADRLRSGKIHESSRLGA